MLDTIDSTSSELLRRAASTDIHRHLLAAQRQTAGRGRHGRRWYALAGGSLTFSLGWRFEHGAERLGGLSLAIGVALARALDALGYRGIELKWPNDLMHGGRKLGGVLVESTGSARGPTRAVVGVGLNVRIPASMHRQVAAPISDLASIDNVARLDRNVLLGRLAAALATSLARYSAEGFAAFHAEWDELDALRNQPVEVLLPDGRVLCGVAAGVDGDGALLVERSGQRVRCLSGEVSVR